MIIFELKYNFIYIVISSKKEKKDRSNRHILLRLLNPSTIPFEEQEEAFEKGFS